MYILENYSPSIKTPRELGEQYRYHLARPVKQYRYHLTQIEIAFPYTMSTNLHIFPFYAGASRFLLGEKTEGAISNWSIEEKLNFNRGNSRYSRKPSTRNN